MNDDLKRRIIENQFVDQVRQWRIDREAFSALRADLKDLAQRWRTASLIDKELVAQIFLILTVTRNMADSLDDNHRLDEASQVHRFETELEGLIFDMLGIAEPD